MRISRQLLILLVAFAALLVLHLPLLTLPYFWDEAGYYVPAARDFLLHGALLPQTTLLTTHPPLSAIYIAAAWKFFGYSSVVTRVTMLAVAAFGLLQLFLLSTRITNRAIAVATTMLFAAYPVFFAQSSLAHADLSATALSLFGLRLYFEPQPSRWRIALVFSFAVLAKETAVLVPITLAAWEFLSSYFPGWARWERPRQGLALLLPVLPLAAWYTFQYARTGSVVGNAGFFEYNVSATLHPLRFALAAVQRFWQVLGHMNMWVLTVLMFAAMLLPPLRDDDGSERRRISIPIQLLFLALITVHIVFHSLIGGALLTRYMLPVLPLVILIAVSTLHRRIRAWKWLVGLVMSTFVLGWFGNPPYRFAPEDNLNYADFVRLHQRAVAHVSQHFPSARVLTAWPASDELSKPYLGYVSQPVNVVRIENFTYDQLLLARQSSAYDVALVFSTKYEPPRRLFEWRFWERSAYRFFDYHRDLLPEGGAEVLGGSIVYQESRNGQWVAIIDLQRIQNAQATSPIRP